MIVKNEWMFMPTGSFTTYQGNDVCDHWTYVVLCILLKIQVKHSYYWISMIQNKFSCPYMFVANKFNILKYKQMQILLNEALNSNALEHTL